MRNIPIYTERPQLLAASQPMIVCICRRVSDKDIARHARAGMGFDEIQFELGVAAQCGKCEGCARDVIAQCGANRPVANIQQADHLLDGSTWHTPAFT